MILENYTPQADFAVGDLAESANFTGDAGEFSELTVAAMSEMHNLTVALARVEHKALTESNDALMEAAVGEFFAKTAETIKKWWNSFIQWLGSLWTRLKDAFVKRSDWLGRNKGAIAEVGDDKLKDQKVKLGKEITNTDFSGAASKAVSECKALIGTAAKVTAEEAKTFKERAQEAITKSLARREKTASIGKNVHDSLIGESVEVELSKSLVGKLIAVAENTFKAVDQMKGAKMVAESGIKASEGLVHMNGGERELMNARFAALKDIGHLVQATIAAYSSAIGTANGQVMPVLVKVAGMSEKKKDEPASPKNEGVLGAYM